MRWTPNDLPLSVRIASGWYRSNPMTTLHEMAEALRADPRLRHFASLDHAEQCKAVCRMAIDGHSPYGIAAATGLSVEAVESILRGEP